MLDSVVGDLRAFLSSVVLQLVEQIHATFEMIEVVMLQGLNELLVRGKPAVVLHQSELHLDVLKIMTGILTQSRGECGESLV